MHVVNLISLLHRCLSLCVYSILISIFFFFKQKTAYEMRISDWSSDVCSSDLGQMGQWFAKYFLANDFEVTGYDSENKIQGKGIIQSDSLVGEIGRAHVSTPVTNAHLVCRLLLEKKKNKTKKHSHT